MVLSSIVLNGILTGDVCLIKVILGSESQLRIFYNMVNGDRDMTLKELAISGTFGEAWNGIESSTR